MGINSQLVKLKRERKKKAIKNLSKMKLSTALIASVAAIDVKTLVNQSDDDHKVPHRHPLQRLWRLYQFSEEIIQTHFYQSSMSAGKLDRMRGRIGKWLYLAQRQSFLRNTKRCGFYNDGLEHGGPSGGEDNQASGIENEQTLLNNGDANTDVVPGELEIFNPRPNRRRREGDDDEDFFNFLIKNDIIVKIHVLELNKS